MVLNAKVHPGVFLCGGNFIAAFALVVMLTVAATHQHFSNTEDSDCVVCSVVHHDASGPVSVQPSIFLALTYTLAVFNPHRLCQFARTSSFLQPPSCGPPSP